MIAPSVLSLDYCDFNKSVLKLNENADWLHFDVMDGHFVPNLTFGPDILKSFRKSSSLFMDVHLMVTDPIFFTSVFVKAGADQITFHLETCEDSDAVLKTIKEIKDYYVKVGISIKPNTDVLELIPYLDKIDTVLIMSVEPGFGGQSFIESSYEKIKYLNEYRKNNNLNYLIEVDGGVNDQNSHKLFECGTDVLVAGSYIFKGDIEANINKLKNAH